MSSVQSESSRQRADSELELRTPRTKLRVVTRSVAFDQDAMAFDHLQDYVSDLSHDDPGAVELALRTTRKPLMLVVRNEEFDADPHAFEHIHKYVPALLRISEHSDPNSQSSNSDANDAQEPFAGFDGDHSVHLTQNGNDVPELISSDEYAAELTPCTRSNSMPVEIIKDQEAPHAVLPGQTFTMNTKSPLLGGWEKA